MSHKRREQRRQRHRGGEDAIRWAPVLRSIVLGGAMALLVVSAIIPSESAVSESGYAPIAAGWCLLLVLWAASLWVDDQPVIRAGWTEAAGAAFVGWHSLAAVMWLGYTNGRLALNAHWVVLSYAIGAFLIRQSLRAADQARSLLVAMLWLATLLGALGLYQYFYGMPLLRREYAKDPERILAENNVPTDPQAPLRVQFENRVRSVEPLATFGLTNSLAGFLAPWFIAALALGMAMSDWRRSATILGTLATCILVIDACLVLTKSRSAYLAAAAGLVLLAMYGRRRGWRLDWRIPAAVVGVGLVIGLAAVYFGGLDAEVLTEAPKSVLYRLEYWQATARLIVDHPLFGCGPGNFQEAYAAYKLPQASETVADPHNFLLEIWATAGTPALILLLALMAGFVIDLAALTVNKQSPQPAEEPVAPAPAIVLGGAFIGLTLGPWISAALGFRMMDTLGNSFPVVWIIGVILLPLAWWSLRTWIDEGGVTIAALVVPQLVLLINLLAAGALLFPGVASTLVVLAPLGLLWPILPVSATDSAIPRAARPPTSLGVLRPSRAISAAIFVGSALLALTCLYTEYYPVMNGRPALANARYEAGQHRFEQAEEEFMAAARADSLWPEPWQELANLRLGQWYATERADDWTAFVEAADTYKTLDPRHHVAWFTRGNWFLAAWKKSLQKEQLDEALAAFRRASERFPSHALYHAQVAWTLHLAGDAAGARDSAERAWRLDQQMPHQEKKLSREHVVDPDLSRDGGAYREETAEQTVERLRSSSAGPDGASPAN
jgi:tetratricopeptide (TPR) repeat protein